ncbi:MAG TPA: hypothetical protein VNU66_09705, partial [Mycobacteriales bacterium]|nr:hypothetical protein [Mycobacteriales bacterium]
MTGSGGCGTCSRQWARERSTSSTRRSPWRPRTTSPGCSGQFEAQAGDPARAEQLAAAANAARPENVFVDDALAAARLAAGDAAGAAAPGAEALRLGTASPHVRATAAALAGAGGDAATAREHLAVVLRGAPWA